MSNNSSIDARFHLQRQGFALDVEFTLDGQSITAIQGPSGSGKTTLLRCIAGLEPTSQGFLRVNDAVWQDNTFSLPPHRRSIGYVFQEDSLFEHLSARQNILFGCTQRREIPSSLSPIIDVLEIGHLLARKPSALSGGERQRIAIARAFATEPDLLLMDEPLSALDASKRHNILSLITEIHAIRKTPILYVTHAPAEAEQLTDQLIYMKNGRMTDLEPAADDAPSRTC